MFHLSRCLHLLKMKIRFRKYEEDDLSQLQHLMEELGYSVETTELRKNIEEINKRDGRVIIAEEKQKVVGSICVIIDARLAEGVYAEIVSLVVDSTARGKGIGRGLVEKAEQWASGKACKIRVRANEIRNDAHSFYEALGYNCIKKQKIFIKLV